MFLIKVSVNVHTNIDKDTSTLFSKLDLLNVTNR